MKFEVIVDFSVGGYQIWFEKTFDMPFAPFIGMRIYDEYKGHDLTVRFDNDEFNESEIGWMIKGKKYYGQVKHLKLTPHYLKENYENYLACGWKECSNNANIEKTLEILTANQK